MTGGWYDNAGAGARFEAAVAYDRYRPHYPDSMFDDIVAFSGAGPGTPTVEVGAGTGIATEPLVARGLNVTAIEPETPMAAVITEKLGGRCRVVVERFEDWTTGDPADLVVACNAWHWVRPAAGVRTLAEVLRRGGTLALAWTQIVSWGGERFDVRVSEVLDAPWSMSDEIVVTAVQPLRDDPRFEELEVRRHRFSRTLSAADYVAVRHTYGGRHDPEEDERVRHLIDAEFGGSVTKVEDAVLFLTRFRSQ